jgi:ABC-type dipeptide/oligopeptide/nickel transport system permease subunit
MKSRVQIVGQKIAAVIGGIAAIPLSVWGFIIGGDFIGSWTRGFLAIPGALLGAAIVVAFGAGLGWLLFSVGFIAWQALSQKTRH